MTNEQFEEVVKKLEVQSKKSPRMYKFKVFMVALLGFTYVFGILLLALIIIGATVYLMGNVDSYSMRRLGIRLIIPVAILSWIIVKSLWVKFDKPQGIILNEADQPNLYQMVRDLQKQLKAPRVHEILLTSELNAALYQYPRLGILGFYKNYLILGLPLLMILSDEEVKSVIAHEMGHLSGKHSKFGAYIYRLNQTWYQLFKNLQENQERFIWLFKKFTNWFFPIFNAYTFVLRREQEYQADMSAVKATDSNTFSSGLIKLDISNLYYDELFWKNIYDQVKIQDKPVYNVYHEMLNETKKGIEENKIEIYKKIIFSRETQSIDTHPSIKDRINHIKGNVNVPLAFNNQAVTKLIEKPEPYIQFFSDMWTKYVNEWWQENYKKYQELRVKLSEYRNKENKTIDEHFEMAHIIEELEDKETALKLYNEILEENNEYIKALFSKARILLEKQDDKGKDMIEDIISQSIKYTSEGCKLIYEYLINKGNIEEAKNYLLKAQAFEHELALAKEEREHLRLSDEFVLHNLNNDTLNKLKQELKQYPNIKDVYLVCKDVNYLKEMPLYIIGIKFLNVPFNQQGPIVNKIAEELSFSDSFYVVPLTPANQKLEEKFKNIKNALII